jgi:hypothetical protein
MALCAGVGVTGAGCTNAVLSDGQRCISCVRRDEERRLLAAAEEANERIASCHEVVACPKCGAPVGKRCRAMPRGFRPLDGDGRVRVLKTPHKQRWTLVQPAR